MWKCVCCGSWNKKEPIWSSHNTLKLVLSREKTKKIPDVNFYFAHLPLPQRGGMKAMQQCIMTFWGVQCHLEKLASEPKAKEVSWRMFFCSLSGYLPGCGCQLPLTLAKVSACWGSPELWASVHLACFFTGIKFIQWLGKQNTLD